MWKDPKTQMVSARFAFPYSSLLLSLCWLHSNLAASMLWYNYFSSKRVFLLGVVTNIPLLSLLTLTPISLMSAACHPKISVAGGCDVFKPYRALCVPTLSLIRVLLLVEVTWCWTDPNNFELIGALWLESKMAEFIACLKKCVLCPFELLYFLKNHFYKGAEFEWNLDYLSLIESLEFTTKEKKQCQC